MSDNSAQAAPRARRKGIPWRKDLTILKRLPDVERLHFEGVSNYAIAAQLHVDEGTIRGDLKRLQELWLERIAEQSGSLRAQAAAELDDLKRRALNAASFDEMCERAVLFDEELTLPDGKRLRVERDAKGSAQFRGNKAAAINVARQAVMDRAKVLGVLVDKVAQTDTGGKDISLTELMERHAHAAGQQTPADS